MESVGDGTYGGERDRFLLRPSGGAYLMEAGVTSTTPAVGGLYTAVRRFSPQPAGPERADPKALALALLPAALTTVVFVALFAQPMYLLVRDWWTLPEAGH